MTGSANTKHFAELAKAWLCDKDIDEGKMWHYYVYLMCDDDENDYKAYERMHGSHSYRSPEYEHRMGRERGYDYEARSYQYPYSRYDMVKQSLEDCRIKKESLSKIDEEMRRCEDILKILNVNSDITTNVTKDFKELDELRAEVKELKQLLQNISTVRPEENNIDPPTEEKENEI